MIDDFDLLFYHRHPPGKIVVLPDLPCQLPQLLIRYGLGCPQGIFPPPVRQKIAQHDPRQRQQPCDQGCQYRCVHPILPSFSAYTARGTAQVSAGAAAANSSPSSVWRSVRTARVLPESTLMAPAVPASSQTRCVLPA